MNHYVEVDVYAIYDYNMVEVNDNVRMHIADIIAKDLILCMLLTLAWLMLMFIFTIGDADGKCRTS